LDRKTGEVAVDYDDATFPEWVVFHRGDLYMSAGGRYSRRLMCIDSETGRVKWRSELELRSSGPLPNFVVADELGYYLDWQRLTLGCVELATGKSRWEQDVSEVLTRLKWRYGLCSHGHGTLVVGEGMRGVGIHAFADKDGKHLWSRQYSLVVSGRGQRHKGSTYDDGFFIDGLYWTHVGLPRDAKGRTIGGLAWEGLDPATGKVQRRFAYSEDVVVGDSCHRTQATVNYFMGGHSRFVSTKTGEYVPRAYGIHNSCRFGMLPANGLTYTWSLYTATYVRGVMGLATGNDGPDGEIDGSERFVKGPAYDAVKRVADDAAAAWTCFRGDPQRSARSRANAFQAKPSLLWQTKFDSDLSPTVAVGDLAFVAQPDAYRVVAVRVGSGEVAWKFLTGGRVTSPPTVYQGLCLFGCADGWTYCLTASDGKLVWRFRAARREQLIVDRRRLASVWPVDGGVLVDKGLACFAAGRHGTLDGGVDLYAVKPATGELVWTRRLTNTPVISLLASDGTSISLGGKTALDLNTGEPASRRSFSPVVYQADVIDLTQRLGAKGDDLRSHPTLNVVPTAVVRPGEVALVTGRLKDQSPALTWVEQRNSVLVTDDVSARHDPKAQCHLSAFSTKDGKLLWTQPLPSAAIFDGITVSNDSTYLTTFDGQLIRFGHTSKNSIGNR
ncbi:MAG: PQQ-binding-like beta-propeller repeat protein, partial [Planctomycetota bacterium]|nr:PQQ-binding-like beta-propeller repeat protein [Planctomycetota bacterium]